MKPRLNTLEPVIPRFPTPKEEALAPARVATRAPAAAAASTSSFTAAASAPEAVISLPAAAVPPAGPTVTAAQLANGTARLDALVPAASAAPQPRYEVRTAPSDLAGLLSPQGTQPALSRQAVVDTVLAALPAGQRAAAQELVTAGVTDESLAQAFSQVLEARKSPGDKVLSLTLVALETRMVSVGSGDSSYDVQAKVPGSPSVFQASLSVAADGSVNSARLAADVVAETAAAYGHVDPHYAEQTLRGAGLSDLWLSSATPAQKTHALGQILEATRTGGAKSLDFSFSVTTTQLRGDNEFTEQVDVPGRISFEVDAEGRIGGKAVAVKLAALAMQRVEAMSAATRRDTLSALGFPSDAIAGASGPQIEAALVRASVATGNPGEDRFEVGLGGDTWAVGMKIGSDGEILGAGVARIPPPPKSSTWKKVVGVVCTVVSICYPPAALICQGIQGALALSSGAKGLALIGAVAGAAAGVASVAGAAAAASSLSTAASVANASNSAVNAARSGNVLAALSSAAQAAGTAGLDLGVSTAPLATASSAVEAVRAVRTQDLLSGVGSLTAAAAGAARLAGEPVSAALATVTEVAGAASALARGDWDAAARSITGLALDSATSSLPATVGAAPTPALSPLANDVAPLDEGPAAAPLPSPGPRLMELDDAPAQVTDVRRIDNATVDSSRPTQRTVRSGDTLSRIASEAMGDPDAWPELYAYNAARLGGDPNRLTAGAQLQVPPADYRLPEATRAALFQAAHREPPPPRATQAASDWASAASVAADAITFGSLSDPLASPVALLGAPRLGQVLDAAAAQAPAPVTAPPTASGWSAFTNGAANTVRLLAETAGALVPGTAANQRVSGAIAEFGRSIAELASRAAADPAGTGAAVERAVGRAVFTVMDVRQWGEAAPRLFEAVVHATVDGTGRLAERLAQAPDSVEPGQLVLDALGAAAGLSNVMLVGSARNAVTSALRSGEAAAVASQTGADVAAAVSTPSWRVAIEQNLGNPLPGLVDTTLAQRSTAVANQFAGTGVDVAGALYHGTNSGALLGIASGEGLLPLGALRAQGRVPFSGELSGWGTVRSPTESWNSYALSSFTGADLNLGLRNYVEGFNRAGWTPELSARRVAMLDQMPALEGAQQGLNRAAELERQVAWQRMSPAQRALVSDPFPLFVELRPQATRAADEFSVQALGDRSGRAVATEVGIAGGVTSQEISAVFVPADRVAQTERLLAESGRANIPVRALEPLQARTVDPLDLVADLRAGRAR